MASRRSAILAQYVKDLSFENPNAPAVYPVAGPAANGRAGQYRRLSGVGLGRARGGAEDRGSRRRSNEGVAFRLRGAPLRGACSRSATSPRRQLQPFLLAEAPRLLFPFARQIISSAVDRRAGFPPLLLDPIDFGGLYMAEPPPSSRAMKRDRWPVRRRYRPGVAHASRPTPFALSLSKGCPSFPTEKGRAGLRAKLSPNGMGRPGGTPAFDFVRSFSSIGILTLISRACSCFVRDMLMALLPRRRFRLRRLPDRLPPAQHVPRFVRRGSLRLRLRAPPSTARSARTMAGWGPRLASSARDALAVLLALPESLGYRPADDPRRAWPVLWSLPGPALQTSVGMPQQFAFATEAGADHLSLSPLHQPRLPARRHPQQPAPLLGERGRADPPQPHFDRRVSLLLPRLSRRITAPPAPRPWGVTISGVLQFLWLLARLPPGRREIHEAAPCRSSMTT